MKYVCMSGVGKLILLLTLLMTFRLGVSGQVPSAFLFGDGVKVRFTASKDSEVAFRAAHLTPVEVIRVTTLKESAGKADTCEYYPWVEVRFVDGRTGFVFGKSVYQISGQPLFTATESPDQPQCESFLIYSSRNFSLGSTVKDSRGKPVLSGCADYTLPVFWFPRRKALSLLKLDQSVYDFMPDFRYWVIVRDMLRGDIVQNLLRPDGNNLHIVVYSKYDEGCGGYEVMAPACHLPLEGRVINRYRSPKGEGCK